MSMCADNDVSDLLDQVFRGKGIRSALVGRSEKDLAYVSSLARSHSECAINQAGSIGSVIGASLQTEEHSTVSDLGFAIKHLNDYASLMLYIAEAADDVADSGEHA
ncbi:MAG: hypothetical protein ABIQ70_07020 [Dokdonella sp.]